MLHKKVIAFLTLTLVIFTSACGNTNNHIKRPHMSSMSLFDKMEEKENTCVKTAVESLKSGDKETFKKIFADSIVAGNADFDKKVDDVFDFVEGNILSYEVEGMSPESTNGEKYVYFSDNFYCVITTDVDKYTIHFKYKMIATYFLRKIQKSGVYLFEILSDTAAENSGKTNFFRDIEGVYVIEP